MLATAMQGGTPTGEQLQQLSAHINMLAQSPLPTAQAMAPQNGMDIYIPDDAVTDQQLSGFFASQSSSFAPVRQTHNGWMSDPYGGSRQQPALSQAQQLGELPASTTSVPQWPNQVAQLG